MVLEAAFAQKLGLQHLRAQEAHASRSEGQKFGGFGWLARCFSPLGRPCIITIPKEKLEGQEIVEYAMRLTLAIPGVRPPGW